MACTYTHTHTHAHTHTHTHTHTTQHRTVNAIKFRWNDKVMKRQTQLASASCHSPPFLEVSFYVCVFVSHSPPFLEVSFYGCVCVCQANGRQRQRQRQTTTDKVCVCVCVCVLCACACVCVRMRVRAACAIGGAAAAPRLQARERRDTMCLGFMRDQEGKVKAFRGMPMSSRSLLAMY